MTLPMKALTVRQPFADAIVHGHPTHGPKTTENRSKPIPAKYLGTTIIIHAGKDPHPLGDDVDWEQRPDARMAIIGTVRLIGVHIDNGCCTPWGMAGYFHWQLADARPLPTPNLNVPGQLGLWAPASEPTIYPTGAIS